MPLNTGSPRAPPIASGLAPSSLKAEHRPGPTAVAGLAPQVWIPLVYAFVAGVWIAFSDVIVAAVARTSHEQALWSIGKGFGFVGATALLLHVGIRWSLDRERRARRELEVSERLLRAIAEAIPEPVFVKDREGKLVFANRALLAGLGKSAEEVLGRDDRQIYGDPAVGAALMENDQRVMASGEVAVLEERIETRDGMRLYLTTKSPFRDAEGGTVGVVGVARDVTLERRDDEERRRAEEVVQESRAKLEAALASTTDAISISDADGRLVDFNQAFATYHRFASKADCKRTLAEYPEFLEVFTADGAPAPLHEWAVPRALRGETASNAEYTLRRRDTGETWVGSYSFAPIRRQGQIVGSVVVARDVTDRKRGEEALREREERLAVTLRSIGDAVIATDQAGRVTLLNGVAEALTGFKSEEAVGQPLEKVFRTIDEGTRQPIESPVECVLKSGAVVELANHAALLARDGSERPIADSGAPIRDASGRLSGVVLVFRDQTRERRAERALREELALRDQLAKVAESVPGAICSFRRRADGTASMPFSTPAIEELYGIPRATLARDMTPVFARIHADDLREVQDSIEASARSMTRWNGHFRYHHPTKGLRFMEGSSVPVREPEGSILWHGFVMDVTDRRQAELAREENEALYRTLFTLTPSGVVLLDEEGRLRAFNDQAHQQLGYTREEFAHLSVSDIDVAEKSPELLRGHLTSIAEANGEEFAAHHRTKSGRIRDVLVNSRPVELRGERHFVAIWHDVTERTYAAAALRESDERFRVIFEQAAVGMAEVEAPSGRYLRVNDRFCQIVGRSREELVARTWQDITHPADLASDLVSFDELIADHRPYTRQKRYLRQDGTPVWVELTVTPMWAQGAAPTTFASVVQDVTARKEAELALAESEQRFRALIEKSTDMILVLDAGGRFRFFSPSATEVLGLTAEEALGQAAEEMVHPEDWPHLSEILERLRRQPGDAVREVVRLRHRDGTWRGIEVTARNLLQDPAVRGVVLNGRDVTGQKLLEEQLRQAQKLESIGRLAGGVAHDLNNILTVILSCTEELLADGAQKAEARREDAEQIRSAATRASDLTRQLLAFARKQVIAPVPLDLNALVRGMEKLLRRVLGEDVELAVRLSSDLWHVRCDPGQLEQVILNLAVNARDAMPHGGRLTMESHNALSEAAETAELCDVQPGPWVRLVFRDSGTGMSEEVKAHLFEPFFSTKEPGRGTGLGLATVHGIVGQAGGHHHVASQLGEGSTFTVCLPPTTEPLPGAVGKADAAVHGTECVLVIEDDPLVRQVIVRALQRAGFQVLAAGNGAEALKRFREHRGALDLVITDVVMPGLSGRAVVGELERLRPGLRVLYVSGYTQDAIVTQGVLDEGIHFLPKPFTAAALLERVRLVLGSGGRSPGR